MALHGLFHEGESGSLVAAIGDVAFENFAFGGLLIDACSRLGSAIRVPDTGSLSGDLRALATYMADQLRTAAWTSVYPSIIDAAERDPEIAAMQSALHKGLMSPFDIILERAKARHEIREEKSATDLAAAVAGPMFYRRWFSKEAIDDAFVYAVVDAAAAAIASA